MAKTVKNIRLDNMLIGRIAEIADAEYQGNFTATIECLLNQSIVTRSVDDKTKWSMYSAAKQGLADRSLDEKDYHNFITTLTTALHV